MKLQSAITTQILVWFSLASFDVKGNDNAPLGRLQQEASLSG